MTELLIEGNYLKISQPHATPDGSLTPIIAYYPITLSFISFDFEIQTDKSGKQAWTPYSVTIHNTALNANCIITNADVIAGNVSSGKTIFATITELTTFLSSRTGSPIDDTESATSPIFATPIKTLG